MKISKLLSSKMFPEPIFLDENKFHKDLDDSWFWPQLVYKPHFLSWIIPFGQLRAARGKSRFEFFWATFEGGFPTLCGQKKLKLEKNIFSVRTKKLHKKHLQKKLFDFFLNIVKIGCHSRFDFLLNDYKMSFEMRFQNG